MNFVDSFILATAFSYLAAGFLPYQFDKKTNQLIQKASYLVVFSVLFINVILKVQFWAIWGILSLLYSVLAVYCFGGGQDWGSTGHNIFMTTWDLALAICFLSKIDF